MNRAGDSVLFIACTRGHVAVIDYLVKDKGCDLNGEVTVLLPLAGPSSCFNIVFVPAPWLLGNLIAKVVPPSKKVVKVKLGPSCCS